MNSRNRSEEYRIVIITTIIGIIFSLFLFDVGSIRTSVFGLTGSNASESSNVDDTETDGADAEDTETDGADAEDTETDGADAEDMETDGADAEDTETDGADAEDTEADDADAEDTETDDSYAEIKEGITLSDIGFESSTEDRIIAIMTYLVEEQGFTIEAAAAVCGNAAVESCYTPQCFMEDYFGLFMWNYLEEGNFAWEKIASWMISNGYDTASFEGQMKAFIYTDHGQMTEEIWEEFISLENVDQAVELFTIFYEGCPGGITLTEYYDVGNPYQGLATRKSEAWQAYWLYTGEQISYSGEKPYLGYGW